MKPLSKEEAYKIEVVTEAIEELVLQTTLAYKSPPPRDQHKRVLNARELLKKSLVELLRPTLRVVTGGTNDHKPRRSSRS